MSHETDMFVTKINPKRRLVDSNIRKPKANHFKLLGFLN